MSIWPFRKKQVDDTSAPTGPSNIDRLLNRNCTREEFFLLYSKLLQERLPDHRVEFSGESTLRIVGSGGEEATTYLDNLWLKYQAGNEDRSELIEKYVRLALDLGGGAVCAPLERRNIVPIIKDSQYLEHLKPREAFAIEHLCGDIWIIYAEDQPERTVTLKRENIQKSGVSEPDLHALAVENLKRILPPSEVFEEGSWYSVSAGSDYSASLLLVEAIWEQMADLVPGDIVATVPTRDVLLFTGSESGQGLQAIKERATELCSLGPHAISDTLLVRRNGTWSVYNAN